VARAKHSAARLDGDPASYRGKVDLIATENAGGSAPSRFQVPIGCPILPDQSRLKQSGLMIVFGSHKHRADVAGRIVKTSAGYPVRRCGG